MPKYDVRLTGLAYMKGSLEIEADSAEEAERSPRLRNALYWAAG